MLVTKTVGGSDNLGGIPTRIVVHAADHRGGRGNGEGKLERVGAVYALSILILSCSCQKYMGGVTRW